MAQISGLPGDLAAVPGDPAADRRWLRQAIELSRRCPPSSTAFSVGAILVSQSGAMISTGYSRERDPSDHAEETALAKTTAAAPSARQPDLPPELAPELTDVLTPVLPPVLAPVLAGATIYSSLEPCRTRASRPRSCAELILAAGLRRVVLAWLEPPLFVPGGGAAWLRERGVTVVEIPELAAQARAVNAHLLPL
jgi:diaminohydroxyphosphoribosylaminopyrimidine deaminase / 5-amino-6-(5-phosphoribosylamino)uracil reductase